MSLDRIIQTAAIQSFIAAAIDAHIPSAVDGRKGVVAGVIRVHRSVVSDAANGRIGIDVHASDRVAQIVLKLPRDLRRRTKGHKILMQSLAREDVSHAETSAD